MLCKNEVIRRADELNKTAAKLMPLPDGLTQPEQLLYKSLCFVYRDYKIGKLTYEQARKEKQELYKAYTDAAYSLDMWRTYQKIVNVFRHKQYEIKNNGCEVCRSLERLLCGLK
ncbi:MAG: hypothetical protein Q4E74_11640 [Ruminococcus sp.]|nr:hypothetical protein [Ruminococcus sp.]